MTINYEAVLLDLYLTRITSVICIVFEEVGIGFHVKKIVDCSNGKDLGMPFHRGFQHLPAYSSKSIYTKANHEVLLSIIVNAILVRSQQITLYLQCLVMSRIIQGNGA